MNTKNKNGDTEKDLTTCINSLFEAITASPTAYHAADYFYENLKKNHVLTLPSDKSWPNLISKKKKDSPQLVVNMQDGTLLAASIPPQTQQNFEQFANNGKLRLWIAHTDSPSLKIKNDGALNKSNAHILTTEAYGGIIDESWFNCDLSIAGRVTTTHHIEKHLQQNNNSSRYSLVNLERPLAIIPTLAPHLTNSNKEKVNRENQLRAILSTKKDSKTLLTLLKENLLSSAPNQKIQKVREDDILSYDLFLYPTEKPQRIGSDNNLIASRCLDNLAMCHAGIIGFLQAQKIATKNTAPIINIIALFNHEEIGSLSFEGAASFVLHNFLKRLLNALFSNNNNSVMGGLINEEVYSQIIARSIAVSGDMAHPSYYNFPEKNSETHEVKLNNGIVLKRKSTLQYATQSFSEAYLKTILNKYNIPWQIGIGRSDMQSGTTLGPIISSRIGIPVADIGSALFSMHSTREVGGAEDHLHACNFAQNFFS